MDTVTKAIDSLKGYEKVSYNHLCSEMDKRHRELGKTDVELAVELGVKSSTTARNVFQIDTQIVSDEILTKAFSCLGIDAFVTWSDGKRNYYLKLKNGKK